MKNIYSAVKAGIVFLLIFSFNGSHGQSPQLFSYQAILRDGSDAPMANASVDIVISIIAGNPTGTTVYTENHSKTTNQFGLVNLMIGGGTTTDDFSAIDWSSGPYFVKVTANSFDMGTTQLLSVPYALHASTASTVKSSWVTENSNLYYLSGNVGVGTKTPLSTLSVEGTTPGDSAIFEVKNNTGQTVFAVYNEGVRVFIDESAKAKKGGFAIGGFDAAKGFTRDYMRVSVDSIRMYIDNTSPAKGTKGGFAIGGFDKTKGGESRYMTLTGSEGLNTGYNTFLGYEAGSTGAGGKHNIAIGYYSGLSIDNGQNNVFIGDSAGLYTSSGYENIFIGRNAGAKMFVGYNNIHIGYRSGSEGHGQYNVMIGDEAGRYNNNGYANVFLGDKAGRGVTNGYYNTFLGSAAGWIIGTGKFNVFVGGAAGIKSVNASYNTFIGSQAGDENVSGNSNTYIGFSSAFYNNGSNNIFIGANSGKDITSADYQLVVDVFPTTDPSTAFINGNMQTDQLRFNAAVGVKTAPDPAYSLKVNGNAVAAAWSTTSDLRLKRNINDISSATEKISRLRGVTFRWNSETDEDDGLHMGLIAQETFKAVPEAVNTKGEYLSIDYSAISAILVEAVKELKTENEMLRERIGKLESFKAEMEILLNTLMTESGK